jgi:hypothetical protein
MNKPPLAARRHRVCEFLAQEAETIGQFCQILNAGRVSLELLVETRDGARVLEAAKFEFLLALALALLINARQRHSQTYQNDRRYRQDQDKREAGTISLAGQITAARANQRFGGS